MDSLFIAFYMAFLIAFAIFVFLSPFIVIVMPRRHFRRCTQIVLSFNVLVLALLLFTDDVPYDPDLDDDEHIFGAALLLILASLSLGLLTLKWLFYYFWDRIKKAKS